MWAPITFCDRNVNAYQNLSHTSRRLPDYEPNVSMLMGGHLRQKMCLKMEGGQMAIRFHRQKLRRLPDSGTTTSAPTRFWDKSFSAHQILGQKLWRLPDFETALAPSRFWNKKFWRLPDSGTKVSAPTRFGDKSFGAYQILGQKFRRQWGPLAPLLLPGRG